MAVLEIGTRARRSAPRSALDGLSLSLGEGEMLGLLGPNGAGKTTLIRAIAGRVRLDGGTVSLLRPRARRRDAAADLGVVPQEIALYPLLTARENLETFGRLHGLAGKRLRERVAWALEWTGLADRAKRAGARLLGRHEAPAQHRLRRAARAEARAARRADRRRGPAEPRADLRDARQRCARDGRVAAAHHAPARGGRGALRPHRDPRPRPRDRGGHAGRAGGAGRALGPPRAACRWTAPRERRPRASRATAAAACCGARSPTWAASCPSCSRACSAAGLAVRDLEVRTASLQAVFLHSPERSCANDRAPVLRLVGAAARATVSPR